MAMQREQLEHVGAIIVVGSGKGGVGKSTVSVNLAVSLARLGLRVGLLDGDAYGPSLPMMLGVRKRVAGKHEVILPLAERKDLSVDKKIPPLLRYGIKIMSLGFFVGEEQAVAPLPDALGMLMRQMLYSVNWGTLDYLIIDLPPGTSEPQATLCREFNLTGAILVTTPQDIARIDTAKALAMFQRASVPVLGVIQNMDSLLCPHCGESINIFPGSQEIRSQLDELPCLGRIPFDPVAVLNGDKGYPIVVSLAGTPIATAFSQLAEQTIQQVAELRSNAMSDEASQTLDIKEENNEGET
jgi:ATP-binding protein involved in chromosome partitioning